MPISAAYGNVIDVQELLELLLHGRLAQIRLLGQDVEPEKKKKKKSICDQVGALGDSRPMDGCSLAYPCC